MEPISPRDTLDVAPVTRAFAAASEFQPLYFGAALQQRIDLVEHLLEFGRQLVVLSGAKGAGKTALLDHLAAGHRPNWCLVRFDGHAELEPSELLALLGAALEVVTGPEAESGLVARIRQRVAALGRAGKSVVLLVDDAGQLPSATVDLLVQLAHTEEQRDELRILFAMDPERASLLESLQQANPQQGLVHVVEVPALTEGQVRELIEHRMRASGFEPEDYFSANDYDRIAALTDGLAGNVVALARQTLIDLDRLGGGVHPPEARPLLSRAQVGLGFAALAALAVVAGGWWANQRPMTMGSGTRRVELEPLGPASSTGLENSQVTAAAGDSSGLPEAGIDSSSPRTLSLPTEPATPGAPGVGGEAPVAEGAPSGVAPEEPHTAAGQGAGTPLPVEPPVGQSASAEPSPAEPETPEPAASFAEQVPAPEPPAAPQAPVAPPPEPAPAPRPEPAARAAPAPAPAPAPAEGLLAMPGTTYTLQLLGLSDRGRAERFLRERGIGTTATIVATRLEGRPFYLIAYGAYPSRAAAQQALSGLPASLKDTKPWARSVASLRQAQ